MDPTIQQQNLASEFFTTEHCFITELANSANDPAASIARARVAPGVTTRWHRLHDTAERYFILTGCGQVEVGELPAQKVNPGDVVTIPPLVRQRITNTGNDDLVFLAICTPRFIDTNYEELGETPP
ncbi:MAG: cupin domain-containing protein [Gammaproteobacteria bacterium]|nr:MAG: cupin domain-containing protein [Gammaproteobacteria bacterium]RLA12245.1 MAG: cupin domain-containing protein [Gammaproteobacteria bacterium]